MKEKDLKFTDDVLNKLNTINNFLNRINKLLEQNKWDEILEIFSKINEINKYLELRADNIKKLIETNNLFKDKYEEKKDIVLKNSNSIEEKIKEWINKQKMKIAGSKNIVDNISKYTKKSDISYFIDKKE